MSPAVPGAGPPGKSWDPVIFEGGKVGACVCVCVKEAKYGVCMKEAE